jgi:hypothetical protein
MTRLFLNPTIKKGLLLIAISVYSIFCFSQASIFEKNITIPNYKGTAKDLFKQIGESNNIVFSYSSNVSLDFEVNFKNKQMKLGDFLELVFHGKSIRYKTNGNKVILYTDDKVNEGVKFTQTVRGAIIDEDSRMPLIGATVIIPGTNPIIGTSTDVQGNFRLEHIPVGRINLHLSYMGYDENFIPNIEVNSGKEVVLNLNMRESVLKLDEITITTGRKRGEAINELALLSARSISIDESKRYTGGMDDPARMVTSYAGVAQTPGGSSDIVVRGNSPKYMQWRLDGVEISSPYHIDDQNASFGALTALNKYLLTSSDFYTGAFSPEYGNVLSNVMDMKLRTGITENFEDTVGIGSRLSGCDI